MALNGRECEGKAVFSALQRVTVDRLLLERCFEEWKHELKYNQEFSVNHFINALDKHIGLTENFKRDLTVALYAALSRDESQLSDIPSSLVETATITKKTPLQQSDVITTKKQVSPHSHVLAIYLQTLIDDLRANNSNNLSDLSEIIFEDIANSEIPSNSLNAIKKWSDDGFRNIQLPKGLSTRACPIIAHFIYVAICDVVGPVTADRLLDNAIRTTSKLPHAVHYSVNKLI